MLLELTTRYYGQSDFHSDLGHKQFESMDARRKDLVI